MIPIFISRPNPFTYEQEYFINNLKKTLKKENLKSVTLQAKDYNPYESLNCLNELIKRCYGMIIISYGQTYIHQGMIKKGAISSNYLFDSIERDVSQTWITSPFCQIEGTLAFNNNLPILILEQKNIKEEGILKKGSHAYFGPKLNLISFDEIDKYFNTKEFNETLDQWISKVKNQYTFINSQII